MGVAEETRFTTAHVSQGKGVALLGNAEAGRTRRSSEHLLGCHGDASNGAHGYCKPFPHSPTRCGTHVAGKQMRPASKPLGHILAPRGLLSRRPDPSWQERGRVSSSSPSASAALEKRGQSGCQS